MLCTRISLLGNHTVVTAQVVGMIGITTALGTKVGVTMAGVTLIGATMTAGNPATLRPETGIASLLKKVTSTRSPQQLQPTMQA